MHHQYLAGKKRETTRNILQCIRSFVPTIFKAEKAEKYSAPSVLSTASNHYNLACISFQDLYHC
jgi:hypothetical protein